MFSARLVPFSCALSLLIFSFVLIGPAHTAPPSKSLQVYFVDVEGGQATLFVTPQGESLLIDTGWPGNNNRDADRIVDAAKRAGISKIDYVLLTHYHADHAGGVPQLAAKIPIGAFIDHGPNRETTADTQQNFENYQKVLAEKRAKRIIVKPGDVLPIEGMHAEVVSADGVLISSPLAGAGAPNPACSTTEKRPADQTENARSLGLLITFEHARILDLGDLTWDKELELVCPTNKIGPVDLFIVSHHGWLQSNSPALLAAISPRVSVMDNGAKKGGSPSSWDIVHHATKQDLWQLHYSDEGGQAHNSAEALIANIPGPDGGNYLKATVGPQGSIEIYNARTQSSKQYASPSGAPAAAAH